MLFSLGRERIRGGISLVLKYMIGCRMASSELLPIVYKTLHYLAPAGHLQHHCKCKFHRVVREAT